MRYVRSHRRLTGILFSLVLLPAACTWGQTVKNSGAASNKSLRLRVMAVPKKGETAKPKTLRVSSYWQFSYEIGSLKPRFDGKIDAAFQPAGYGGGGDGMGMGLGGGYVEEGYGGEGMYDEGGGMDGFGGGTTAKVIQLFAVVDNSSDAVAGDQWPEIKILTEYAFMYEPVPGSGSSYGGDYGGAEMGMGPGGGMGMGMGGPGMGMGGGMGAGSYGDVSLPLLGVLDELNAQATSAKLVAMSASELTLVSQIVRQQVWKDKLIEDIKANATDTKFIELAEPRLVDLLKEQYTTQLNRQKMEIQKIEAKVAKLKTELARREAAAERVIKVQAGRIVLQAQGLLNE